MRRLAAVCGVGIVAAVAVVRLAYNAGYVNGSVDTAVRSVRLWTALHTSGRPAPQAPAAGSTSS